VLLLFALVSAIVPNAAFGWSALGFACCFVLAIAPFVKCRAFEV